MEDSNSMASTSSTDDLKTSASLEPTLVYIKQEKVEGAAGEGPSFSQKAGSANPAAEVPRVKRQYNKKPKNLDRDLFPLEKPPPKKRGRKSKKELLMMDKDKALALGSDYVLPSSVKSVKPKLTAEQKALKAARKTNVARKKSTNSPPGPSVFDKKILAGPHLTMKQVLDYIVTDHSYCVPPDPLPAVAGNHQVIRYILGPKNGGKPRSLPTVGTLVAGNQSPLNFPVLSRARSKLSLTSTPPKVSKLENLLKRGDSSPSTSGRSSLSRTATESNEDSDLEIDIVGVDPEPEKWVAYDVEKAKEVMLECEKYVKFANTVDTGDEFEDKIIRIGWTKSQNSLFDKALGVLHAERLARLAYSSVGDTEPVLRRSTLDRAASRMRRLFGEFMWDTKLTQWLHSVLTDVLNFAYLAIYMDILQTLKAQCPHLISRMMKLSTITPLKTAYGRKDQLKELLSPFMSEEVDNENVKMEVEVDSENQKDKETCGDKCPPVDNQDSEMKEKPTATATDTNIPEEAQPSGEELKPQKPGTSAIHLPLKNVGAQFEQAVLELTNAKNAEAFRTLMERQWDPFSPDLLQRLKKLASNPIFIVIAPGAIFDKMSLNRRLKQYYRMFNRVGKVIKIRPNAKDLTEISPATYLEKMFAIAKGRMREVRKEHPNQSLYLVGWGAGSVLAAKLSVSSVFPVEGVIALGFPLQSIREVHEDIVKVFAAIKHPVLFVIGGLASNNSLTDMELFRRRLTCETSLVVVGSGNENLYVCRDHREKLYVTQPYVDKTVMDEIAYFVNLHSKHGMVTGNISVKHHQFSKNSDKLAPRKGAGRGRKRKLSVVETEGESILPHNEDSKDSCDSEFDRMSDVGSVSSHYSGRRDSESSGFDGPKFNPALKTPSKRKPPYQPDQSSQQFPISAPSSSITASKLLQQNPNVKRRVSKPSGPSQRHSLPNQHFIGTGPHANSTDVSQPSHLGDKSVKRKSATKKMVTKPGPLDPLPSTAIGNPITVPAGFKTQPSYQQPHSSQLFKLLSPGSDVSEKVSVHQLPAQGTHARLGLVASPQIFPDAATEARTTIISKQNLVGNMNIPIVRLRPGEEVLQSDVFAPGNGSPKQNMPTDLKMQLTMEEIQKILQTGRLQQLLKDGFQLHNRKTEESEVPTIPQPVVASASSILEPMLDDSSIIVPIKDLTRTTSFIPTIEQVPKPTELEMETLVQIKAMDPSVVTFEPPPDSEPMETDADQEEEMSGLLISNTFSVCPTSGERMNPLSSSSSPPAITSENVFVNEQGPNNETKVDEDGCSQPEVVSDLITPDLTTPSVPENVAESVEPSTESSAGVSEAEKVIDENVPAENTSTSVVPDLKETETEKDSTPQKTSASDDKPKKSGKAATSTASGRKKPRKKANKIQAKTCKSPPPPAVAENPTVESSKDCKESSPTEKLDEGESSCVVNVSKPESDAKEPKSELSSIKESSSGNESSEQNVIKESVVPSDKASSSQESAKSESTPSDKAGDSETKSGATSTDDEKKSKNNPVRRSARLKSGV